MYEAYEGLETSIKKRIDSLYVIHDHDFIIKQSRDLSKKAIKVAMKICPQFVIR